MSLDGTELKQTESLLKKGTSDVYSAVAISKFDPVRTFKTPGEMSHWKARFDHHWKAKPLSHRSVRGALPTIHQRLALCQLEQWLQGRAGDLSHELEPNRLGEVGSVVHGDDESVHASDNAIVVKAPYIPEIQWPIRTLEDEWQAIDGDALQNSRAPGLRHWSAMVVSPVSRNVDHFSGGLERSRHQEVTTEVDGS
jgi:hypothetical protein